jgi:hypothetical protein
VAREAGRKQADDGWRRPSRSPARDQRTNERLRHEEAGGSTEQRQSQRAGADVEISLDRGQAGVPRAEHGPR